jgi:hypothetical protein
MRAMVLRAATRSASSWSFSDCIESYSCRLRSRELCAAKRFRLTRSMRRCSFSSSVLARLRGGRLVFGSGSTWPHDLRFFTGLPSEADGGGEPDMEESERGVAGGT